MRASVLMGVAVLLYGALLVALYMYKDRLILPGRRGDPPVTPAAAGLAFEEVWIPVDARSGVRAWWIPGTGPAPKTVLYFHGNYETLETEAQVEAPLWHATGANVLLVEYRGYGGSSRLAASAATTDEDARAGLEYLTRVRGIGPGEIVIAGRSIGASVATRLALESPGAARLVLITPITCVNDVANASWVYRVLLRPVQWMPGDDPFSLESRIGAVRIPVTIIAGARDELAQPWMAERIAGLANVPKSLTVIEGADHNDIMERQDASLVRELRSAVGNS